MCPYSCSDAIRLWNKACNFHRGTDIRHICKNPPACQRTLDKAFSVEMSSKGWE